MMKEFRDINQFYAFILILVLTAFFHNISAQGYRYTDFTSENGLSNNSVNCLFQDKYGFLWIGTNNGLSKFDGYVFTNYHTNPSDSTALSGDFITSITEDITGNLWIGTAGGGLNKFDRNKQSFKHYLNDKSRILNRINNEINSVCSDNFGNIWCGTRFGGLYKYNIYFNEFINFKNRYPENFNNTSDSIITLCYAGNSKLLLGTSNGLISYDFQTNILKKYLHSKEEKNSLHNNSIKYIYKDKNNQIWIVSENSGFQSFDFNSGSFLSYDISDDNNTLMYGNISCITEDKDNNLLISNDYNYDIYKFNKKTGKSGIVNYDYKSSNIPNGRVINFIYVDINNILWIGYYNMGLGKYNLNKTKFNLISLKNDPNQFEIGKKIRAISLDDKSNLWLASADGLNLFDTNKNFIKSYEGVPGKNIDFKNSLINSIISDGNGSLWIGTDGGGLIKFEPEKEKFTVFNHISSNINSVNSDYICTLFLDKEEILWIGTNDNGISCYDTKSNLFNTFPVCFSDSNNLRNDNISVIYEDKSGEIWVGTHTAGLICFNRNSEKIARYRFDAGNKNSISSDKIASLCEDNTGNLWIGTENGLEKFDKNTKSFYHYLHKDGLFFEVINAILADGRNNLWLATNSGITKFNISENIFREYVIFDGLQGLEFHQSCCKSSKDEFFFCGVNGVNYFFPDSVTDKPNNSNLIFTSFKTASNSVNYKDNISAKNEINLNYSDNSFSIGFALLDFTRPALYTYAYKLEGLDNEWNYTQSTRSAIYSNLEPGKYIFTVKSKNSDEMWSAPISLLINISSPFWKSIWFYTLWGMILLIVAYANFRKINTFKEHNKILTQDIFDKSQNLEKTNLDLQNEILEKKKIEENLIYSEEQYRLIVENAIEAIIIFHNGYIVYTNPRASQILDYDFKDMSISSFLNYIHPEDRSNSQITYYITSKNESTKNNYSVRIRRNDLREIIIEINSIKLLRNDKYEIIFFIKDITNRKIAETEIKNALEKEKELNELRTRFISMTSHEFRTPLTSINTSVEILEKYSDKITPEQRTNNLIRIQENINKMKLLMNDVLLIGRTDAGMYKLKLEPVDINRLCSRIIDEFKSCIILDTSHKFKYDTDKLNNRVLLDKELIKKVLENLFTNAIKYSPPGSTVYFRMNFSNRFIIFRIKDEGVGIPKEEINNLFEPFYRASNTGEVFGTGLGLAIVKRSVELHNGRISVKSEIGKGTKFIVTIPLIKIV